MYEPFHQETQIQFRIPWDTNTARGFGGAILFLLLLLIFSSIFEFEPQEYNNSNIRTIPLEFISFGEGDGTGLSKGNLTPEGSAHKGAAPTNILQDASISSASKQSVAVPQLSPDDAGSFIARKELNSLEINTGDAATTGSRNIGSPNGTPQGTGLGTRGTGSGLGTGLGDIEWGGGGNRSVLVKKIPVYPPGVNVSAQIRIKFVVASDGTIIKMIPLQKGDPRLEKAAMDALRQWRFNPLKENKEMWGIIPFTFVLKN